MSQNVAHRLRKERRRHAYSQADVCALLGAAWKSKISRYERQQALPPLETALAFEAIYGKPVAELFSGSYARVREDVRRRARKLVEENAAVPSLRRLRRTRSLQKIAA